MTEETSQARRHEEDNNINYMKGNRIGMLKKKSKKGRRHFEDSNGPHYMESSGYDPNQHTGKFPSLLVVRPQVVEIQCARRTRYYQKLGLPLSNSIGSFEGVVGIDEFVGDWFNRIPMKEYSQIQGLSSHTILL